MDTNDQPENVLVYRAVAHSPKWLVFAFESRARLVHEINHAIKEAETWKDFFRLLPDSESRRLRALIEQEVGPIDATGRFNREWLPGYSDGDYPPWLQAEMGACLPAIVLDEFSLRESSSVNGPFWQIPADMRDALVRRLRERGFAVHERSDWDFY